MKKFLSLVLALVMTMSLVTISAGAKDFTDDGKINYDEAVAVMSEVKVLDGYTDGSFNPQGGLTRGAAAKIICNLILGPTTAAELNADSNPYPDVAKDSTFAGYIAYCQKEGIISGYADGTFKPANPLTGYAFMKMLLGALGYDADVEGYTGANWSINVAKQAIGIGLNAGLKDDFNGSAYVTREEAALYAFNTLQATMVDYDTTITIGNVVVAGSRPFDVSNNAKVETIKDDNKMQFAEKYFTKLTVKDDADAFERPCNTWVNGKETIGTFVDYTQIVAEYTTGVAGDEMYDAIGKTAVSDYKFEAYNDGRIWGKDITNDITKNNKADVTGTGNGVLTQVFVDNDNEKVVVTEINTYLAQATMDYNAKKDTVSYKVYDPSVIERANVEPTYKVAAVSGEDFDIEDVKVDDFARVTCTWDNGKPVIQSIDEVEIIEDTEIQKFSTGSSVTVDGTKYSYAEQAEYKFDVLDQYTVEGGSIKNLKDLTYNIYMDQYGYVLGVDLVSTPDNYVFITGVDKASSNLANKTWTANAIFIDGTNEVIDVKDGATAFAAFQDGAYDKINAWFTYTVSNSGVYTLKVVNYTDAITRVTNPASKVAQSWDATTAKIDAKNITLNGINETVYGNDATVYLLADLDKVNGKNVITGVDEVVTGVKNAAFDTQLLSNLDTRVYPLYKSNGYVIAAVVVGESSTIASDSAFFLNDGVDSESYDKTTGVWTWTRTAIINGEEVVLTETNDTGLSVLEGKTINGQYYDWEYTWTKVKYDAKGNVKDMEPASPVYYTMATTVDAIKNSGKDVVLSAILDGGDSHVYSLKGSTMYDETTGELGYLIAEDVKVVLDQEVKNVWETTFSTGVKSLEGILANLNDVVEGVHVYGVVAVVEKGIATSVIVVDFGYDGAYDGPDAGGSKADAITVTVGIDTVTCKVAAGVTVDATDVADAIEAKLNKTGYGNVIVNLANKQVTAEKDGQTVILKIVVE